ncbi:MAG: M12 family metallopeptidase [Actinomycetota bacterium]
MAATTDDERLLVGDGATICGMPDQPPRELPGSMHPGRVSAIVDSDLKWVSGTTLHYYFFDSDEFDWNRSRFRWGGQNAQKQAVRDAFDEWAALNIGIEFVEVDNASEAEVRIGFVHGEGSWSWLGRRILQEPTSARTMNFGWDLTTDPDTALHEIGHTLAMPHEHQNPFSGILWDEEKVYADLAKPPNRWDRSKTFYNILRKLPPESVSGSKWDPNSIMHYPFKAGMIIEPKRYQTQDLVPRGGLSPADKRWVKRWYPPLRSRLPRLEPFESRRVSLSPGEQAQYLIEPEDTRRYTLSTMGEADTVMVLFEEVDGLWRYHSGDDDSGLDRNAKLEEKLYAGRRYQLRLRLYWAGGSGDFGVYMW